MVPQCRPAQCKGPRSAIHMYTHIFDVHNAPEVRCFTCVCMSTTHRRCVVFYVFFVCMSTLNAPEVRWFFFFLRLYVSQRTGGVLLMLCTGGALVSLFFTFVCFTTHRRCVVFLLFTEVHCFFTCVCPSLPCYVLGA